MTRQAPKTPTLRDVAREAGVSVATVSRVLNKSAIVNTDTRAHVEGVIARIGFSPSPVARALSNGRSRMVGVLVPTLDHMIFARFLDAFEQTLSARGLTMVAAVTEGDVAVEEAKARALLAMGVEALVLSGTTRSPGFMDALPAGVPVVLTSCYDPGAPFPTIGYDNRAAATLALSHLLGEGHRAIAVLHGEVAHNDRTRARLAGLRAASGDAALTLMETTLDFAGGCAAVASLLRSGPRVTALLCLSDVLALGAMFELSRHKVDVPGEISLMGFDNMEWTAHSAPRLTTVRLNVSAMGATAAGAVADALELGAAIQPVNVPCALVIRESTAPPGTS